MKRFIIKTLVEAEYQIDTFYMAALIVEVGAREYSPEAEFILEIENLVWNSVELFLVSRVYLIKP